VLIDGADKEMSWQQLNFRFPSIQYAPCPCPCACPWSTEGATLQMRALNGQMGKVRGRQIAKMRKWAAFISVSSRENHIGWQKEAGRDRIIKHGRNDYKVYIGMGFSMGSVWFSSVRLGLVWFGLVRPGRQWELGLCIVVK